MSYRKIPARDITRIKKFLFERIAIHGNQTRACFECCEIEQQKGIKFPRATYYHWLNHDPKFKGKIKLAMGKSGINYKKQ